MRDGEIADEKRMWGIGVYRKAMTGKARGRVHGLHRMHRTCVPWTMVPGQGSPQPRHGRPGESLASISPRIPPPDAVQGRPIPSPVSRFRAALACATLALLLCSITAAPAVAGANQDGHGDAVATKKKKCKKKRGSKPRKKCRGRGGKLPTTPRAPSPQPAPQPAPEPPTAPPPPDPDACGPLIAKSTGGFWTCSFFDDFDGTTLDGSRWLPQRTDTTGYVHGPTACFVDSSNNILVSDGTLKLTARKESAPFTCAPGAPGAFTTQYTSGMVTTARRFSQTYGRFEIRARLYPAQGKGLQTTFWLWPTDATRYGEYPASGEIDIAEMFSQYGDRAVPYIHYKPFLVDLFATNTLCFISNLSAFHTYTLEWTETSLRITYDGRTCLVNNWNPADPLDKPQPFDQPFFILLTQALGVGTNQFDPDTTPLPATTEVDYVRAWK
jgi:beta-glucanase (GH16 family)